MLSAPRSTGLIFSSLLLVWWVAGCGPQPQQEEASQVLLERKTPVTVTTNAGLEHPRFPLTCEAVGFEELDGAFEPVLLLKFPLPRGGSQTRSLGSGWPETVKVYRGTNRVAASNHFLGEFEVSGFEREVDKAKVEVGFSLTTQQDLFLYARGERGVKGYPVRPVGGPVRP